MFTGKNRLYYINISIGTYRISLFLVNSSSAFPCEKSKNEYLNVNFRKRLQHRYENNNNFAKAMSKRGVNDYELFILNLPLVNNNLRSLMKRMTILIYFAEKISNSITCIDIYYNK